MLFTHFFYACSHFKKSLFQKTVTTPLGRWGMYGNKNVKAILANIDCCGDSLCGETKNLKKWLKKERLQNPL